jgi:hypothetical protein
MTQHKVCFTVSEETDKRIKELPRSFNLSEKLREALVLILNNMS